MTPGTLTFIRRLDSCPWNSRQLLPEKFWQPLHQWHNARRRWFHADNPTFDCFTPTSTGAVTDSPTLPIDALTVSTRFEALAAEWKQATSLLSSTSAMTSHPAYQAIIALGWPVVPLLLRDLEREPVPWFAAMEAITAENPVCPEVWGQTRQMAEAWVAWGREGALI
jgi:hypothetical protein